MAAHEGFGALLVRLSDHRRLDLGALSQSDPELPAVLHGAPPSPSLLRRLGPALGLHAADLFVIAGVAVPDDLAPLDPAAGRQVPDLVRGAARLAAEQRRRLREFVRSLPQQVRTDPIPAVPASERYEPSPGALLAGMLRNRNLNWVASATTLYLLTGGVPLSAATIGMVGHGRRRLTPGLLADLATVLGIPADDLAAVTGIDRPGGAPPQRPALPDNLHDGREDCRGRSVADVAGLIWEVRRLTAGQLRQVRELLNAGRFGG